MGEVFKKSGFLGLGEEIREYYCDKCGKYLGQLGESGPIYDDRCFDFDNHKYYCESCANSIDLSIAHNFDTLKIIKKHYMGKFFTDTSDGEKKLVEQCRRCHGLTIHKNTPSGIFQGYYQVGKKHLMQKIFRCVAHEAIYEDGYLKTQVQCNHSWTVVATSETLSNAAHDKFKRATRNRNYGIESMYNVDDLDYQNSCFGLRHYWCWKCGLYRMYNPYQESVLPRKGVQSRIPFERLEFE